MSCACSFVDKEMKGEISHVSCSFVDKEKNGGKVPSFSIEDEKNIKQSRFNFTGVCFQKSPFNNFL